MPIKGFVLDGSLSSTDLKYKLITAKPLIIHKIYKHRPGTEPTFSTRAYLTIFYDSSEPEKQLVPNYSPDKSYVQYDYDKFISLAGSI